MTKSVYRTGLLSAAHFAVDFSCAFLIYHCFLGSSDLALIILLYNFCAFALQLPIGILADYFGRPERFACLGCILCAVSYLIPLAIPAALIAGIGNALFHVGGGCEVMASAPDRAATLGVFVSPGAFGIYFGALLGTRAFPFWLPPICLIALCVLCVFHVSEVKEKKASSSNHSNKYYLLPSLLLFLVVVLRSFSGFAQVFDWKQGVLALAAVCATVFGKTAGGFLSDRIGLRISGVISLGASAALFLLSSHAAAGIAAIFLFNLTMPMTLFALSQQMPEQKGCSFGLLTFALFLGFLPKYFGIQIPVSTGLLLCAVSLISLVLYLPAVKRS